MWRYNIISKLGAGSFGITYLAEDKSNNNRLVAIKKIVVDKTHIDNIIEETDTLETLSENVCNKTTPVVCYYDTFNSVDNGKNTLNIVTEFIDGWTLSGYIPAQSLSVLLLVSKQLIYGLSYIHGQGFAHRDIKPDNIMINNDGYVKYIDFGFACLNKCLIENCSNLCKGRPGSPLYSPPEYFDNFKPENLIVSKAHDIWSLGIILYQLIFGENRHPYLKNDVDSYSLESFSAELKLNRPLMNRYPSNTNNVLLINIHKEFMNLIYMMVSYQWDQRPNVSECVKIISDLQQRAKTV